ncbi:MAG TPA: hypothetical protein PKO06_08455 [Candidatus Ozemobacteraceae bacterium]|nr:hypothetical protein [Candidatus Ozemobacteraceae bacterium]
MAKDQPTARAEPSKPATAPAGINNPPVPGVATPGSEATSTESTEAPAAIPPILSKIYRVISAIAFFGLLVTFFAVMTVFLFTLDFLDLFQWRYKVPDAWRKKWPLERYYDFVKLYQLPEAERYYALQKQNKEIYDQLIASGSSDLRRRADALESAYRDQVQKQEESYKKRLEELRVIQEDNLKMKARLEQMEKDLQARREAVDVMSRQVASEAVNIESSLIRFMEDENRLKPVQEMAASMDPRSVAAIFDEVSDNKLLYDILKGIPPERSALVLSYMDPEKAGKIVKMSQMPPTLPAPGSPRSYLPSSLQGLIASSQSVLR